MDVREIRCPNCNHLLMKVETVGNIQIKCSSCKRLIKITDSEISIVKETAKKLVSE